MGLCQSACAVSKGLPSPEPIQRPQQVVKASVETSEALAVVTSVCKKIVSGDFHGADRIIETSRVSQSKGLEQLEMIIAKYEAVEAGRQTSKGQAYTEQIKEIDKLEQKTQPEDVNDLGDIFLAVIKASEHADEDKKKALLEEPFIKQTIERALRHAREYEAEGAWTEAYTSCYYWLTVLDEENNEYKDHGDELLEKIKIEMSLKDNSCNTSAERHEGVKPEMFLRAVKALDFNYVSIVDYGEMAEKAIKQSQYLGEVLAKAGDDLAYSADAQGVERWSSALEAIRRDLSGSLAVVTRDRFLKIFDEVLALNSITIRIPQEIVIVQFSEASFSALDPYTTLVWPWQVRDFEKNMTQRFPGIGVQISKATGVLKVISLIPNTPAYSSKLDADDVIVAINGEPTKDMTIQCAVSKITGPRGTKVFLTIKHPNIDETEEIAIVRDSINVPTIRGWQRDEIGQWRHLIDPANGVGYMKITNFTETTAPDMKAILYNLERGGLNGLIVDLRDNTGGYLSAAAAVADMFVGEGLIVKSQPRWGISTYETAHKRGTHPGYPVVVLINKFSASASEIVAGALQDEKHRRATLVGERTYGKGSVQTITQLPGEGSQFKYTMAYYHLPSNQRVKNRYVMKKQGRKDWGIEPDVEVKLQGNERRKMDEVHGANEVLAKTDRNDSSKPLKRYSIDETLDADPQLAIGLLVLQSKMIQEGRVLDLGATTPASAKIQPGTDSW
jgi:carboxyl-terminal processing protease